MHVAVVQALGQVSPRCRQWSWRGQFSLLSRALTRPAPSWHCRWFLTRSTNNRMQYHNYPCHRQTLLIKCRIWGQTLCLSSFFILPRLFLVFILSYLFVAYFHWLILLPIFPPKLLLSYLACLYLSLFTSAKTTAPNRECCIGSS